MTRTDRVVLIVLVVTAALLIALRPLVLSRGGPGRVQVEVAGRIIRRLPLLPPSEMRRVSLTIPRGQAVLSFERGGVRLLPMSRSICPRAICSHSGLIRRPGENLVCVPNRLVVRVTGKSGGIDAVAR